MGGIPLVCGGMCVSMGFSFLLLLLRFALLPRHHHHIKRNAHVNDAAKPCKYAKAVAVAGGGVTRRGAWTPLESPQNKFDVILCGRQRVNIS